MKAKPAPRDVPYDDYLVERLKDPAEAAAYLDAVIEDGDTPTLLLALRQVAQAQGMASVARRAKLGRESLYKALSPAGNPSLETLTRLMPALGLRLTVTPAQ